MRCGLRGLESIYRGVVALRNYAFDRGNLKIHQVDEPVVAVGNLTVGGTGKTPIVAWLAQAILNQGLQPAIVSRGYGSEPGKPNDEYLELKQRLPSVVHVQNSERVLAAKAAIKEANPDVIVLDDGFQHRRLHRSLDIVLIDCTRPFGYEHLLPRGLLREPLNSLKRADAIVLTRVDHVSRQEVESIKRRIAHFLDDQASVSIAEVAFEATRLLSNDGEPIHWKDISDQRLFSFCGIGNPSAFDETVAGKLDLPIATMHFPDHHRYDHADIHQIIEAAGKVNAEAVVCTLKDMVKVNQHWPADAIPLIALAIEARFQEGEDDLTRLVFQIIGSKSVIDRSA